MEKDNKLTIITILLALLCLGILGYILYFKANQKPAPVEEKPSVEETTEIEEPKEEEEPVEENILYETVQDLYKIIGSNPEFRYEESVTYETLSENVRDSIVINSLDNECKENSTYVKELFESKYKEIFGTEKLLSDGICTLDGGNYQCTKYCSEFGPAIYNKYLKYEILDDLIIIYETAGHFDYHDDGKIYLKENASDELAIASFNSLTEFEASAVEYKLPTYAHTFKKLEDKYYWLMSEKVEQ